MRVRTLLPVAAVAAALTLSACGEDVEAKNDYIGAVNRAQNQFQVRFEQLEAKITAVSTPRQDDATLREFGTAVDQVIKQLNGIEAPTEVTDLHRKFVAEVKAYGDVAERARKDFRSDDPQAVIAANRTFATEVTKTAADITSTINEINRKLQE